MKTPFDSTRAGNPLRNDALAPEVKKLARDLLALAQCVEAGCVMTLPADLDTIHKQAVELRQKVFAWKEELWELELQERNPAPHQYPLAISA